VGVVVWVVFRGAYLKKMTGSPLLNVVAGADQGRGGATARDRECGGPRARTTDELLKSDQVELVVNLPVPLAHADISVAALRAGEHVFTAKPLATPREDGGRFLDAGAASGLKVGCAPDTFLGAGIQTCL